MFDTIVIGAGFAGAVVARELAQKGERVLVVEQRSHIGGNCYDVEDEHGILIHEYGPHIFHTSNVKGSRGPGWGVLRPLTCLAVEHPALMSLPPDDVWLPPKVLVASRQERRPGMRVG